MKGKNFDEFSVVLSFKHVLLIGFRSFFFCFNCEYIFSDICYSTTKKFLNLSELKDKGTQTDIIHNLYTSFINNECNGNGENRFYATIPSSHSLLPCFCISFSLFSSFVFFLDNNKLGICISFYCP